MSERKMVRRSVAITLAAICIILIAGLGEAISYYTTQINDKDAKYNDYVSKHSHTDYEYNSLQSGLGNLSSENTDLYHTLYLEKSTVWADNQTVSQAAGSYTRLLFFDTSYAGYISVNVLSSTTNTTYVRVIYNSVYIGNYDNQIGVGRNGTANFPFLPTDLVDVRVGNSDLTDGANETVTITYYY